MKIYRCKKCKWFCTEERWSEESEIEMGAPNICKACGHKEYEEILKLLHPAFTDGYWFVSLLNNLQQIFRGLNR